MASIKYKYSERLLALHEEWAVKNGYRDKLQASSDKRAQPTVESDKRQASSCKLQASNGTSSNKR
tara:strand:+ start:242 stop:436 length:195 start_codon:yes stop_codon:yes gene_type:complete